MVIDLTFLLLRGISPIGQLSIAHPAEDRIELSLADQEGIVLRMWGTMVVGEVERNIICDLHNEKRTKGRWVGQAKNPG